ncbi:MAG: hypothetical protein GC168_18195 [Candidatus Hydrogenedens sp.]|nr:hypothetical protein [Candidatus Hydrogenedens sp.]
MSVFGSSVALRYCRGSVLLQSLWNVNDVSACVSGSYVVRALQTRLTNVLLGLGVTAGMGSILAVYGASEVPALAIFLFAVAAPRMATLLLPLAFVISWRSTLGGTADEAVFVRTSDALTSGALLRVVAGNQPRLRDLGAYGPVLVSALVVLTLLLVAALAGVVQGTLTVPQASLLYALQWSALASAGLLAWVYGPELGHAGRLAWCGAVVLAAGFGTAEWLSPLDAAARYRAFEQLWFDGQANHYGGLFAFAACVGAGMIGHRRRRGLGVVLCSTSLAGLYATQSRSGMVAVGAGFAALAVLRYPRLVWCAPLVPLIVFVLPWDSLREAAAEGSSLHDRLIAWKSAMSTVADYPLLGIGTGARHRSFYDNHYVMALAEGGAGGLAAWLWWQWTNLRALMRLPGPAGLGIAAGWIACAVHALANITFLVTVCAGPVIWLTGFWLAAAASESEDI